MKEVWIGLGGFAGGFIVCWFFVAEIKNDINKLRTDIAGWMAPRK